MLQPHEIPETIRASVLDAQKFSVETWRELTSDWDPRFKESARIFRSMGEENRHILVQDDDGTLSSLCRECSDEEDSAVLLLIMLYLRDVELDTMISSF